MRHTNIANTAITKESNNSMSGSVFGAPVTVGGNDILNNSLANSRDFAGDGNSTQSNQITGTVTAQVSWIGAVLSRTRVRPRAKRRVQRRRTLSLPTE